MDRALTQTQVRAFVANLEAELKLGELLLASAPPRQQNEILRQLQSLRIQLAQASTWLRKEG